MLKMSERPPENPLPPLENLDKKIQQAKNAIHSRDARSEPSGSPGNAFRVATELVAAVSVGSYIGWWTDQQLDTLPVFFLICFTLGSAAGFLNIYRMAQRQTKAEEDTKHSGPQ